VLVGLALGDEAMIRERVNTHVAGGTLSPLPPLHPRRRDRPKRLDPLPRGEHHQVLDSYEGVAAADATVATQLGQITGEIAEHKAGAGRTPRSDTPTRGGIRSRNRGLGKQQRPERPMLIPKGEPMRVNADLHRHQPTPPPREGRGIVKSIIEFLTGVTGMLTALLGIIGALVAFAIAQQPPADSRTPIPAPAPTQPVLTPDAIPTSVEATTSSDAIAAVNDICTSFIGEALIDPASADRTAAQRLRAVDGLGPAHRTQVETAANELDEVANTLDQGSTDVAKANGAFQRLASVGAVVCSA
jgi:hypothetical protein